MKGFFIGYIIPTMFIVYIQGIIVDKYSEIITDKQGIAMIIFDLLLLVGIIVGFIFLK